MAEIVKILYEHEEPDFLVEEYIDESTGEKGKKYKIKGTFSTIAEKNRNGRIYPKHLWEAEIAKYQQVIKEGSINRLMEWEHPNRNTVDPMEAVACIDSIKIEGNRVIGEATILNNEKGNQLKNLIDNGIKISVSSRGTGKVGNNGIVEKFDLITWDAVAMPSDYNATMNGYISESQESFLLTESGELKPITQAEIDALNAANAANEPEAPKVDSAEITRKIKESIDKLSSKRIGEALHPIAKQVEVLEKDLKFLLTSIKRSEELSQYRGNITRIEKLAKELIEEVNTLEKELY